MLRSWRGLGLPVTKELDLLKWLAVLKRLGFGANEESVRTNMGSAERNLGRPNLAESLQVARLVTKSEFGSGAPN